MSLLLQKTLTITRLPTIDYVSPLKHMTRIFPRKNLKTWDFFGFSKFYKIANPILFIDVLSLYPKYTAVF